MKFISLKSKKILGIPVTTSPKEEILEEIQKYLEKSSERPMVIATPNPEQIVAAQTNTEFAEVLNQADVALPDGIGLAWAAGCKRVPGVEFMEDLVELAASRGYRIGLIGGRAAVAVRALECLSRRTSGLRGWAIEPGDIDLGALGNLGDVVEKIRSTNTRIVFVGLGAPKQEFFIEKLQETCSRSPVSCLPLVLMSVGGSFDMISGRTPRAPLLFQTMGLEWFWRLCREPWRWRRQLALLKFLWLLAEKSLPF